MSVDRLSLDTWQNKMAHEISLNNYNVISAFRRHVNAIVALLGRYAVVIGSHWRFAKTYLPHLQRSRERRKLTTNRRCLTSQKSEDKIIVN